MKRVVSITLFGFSLLAALFVMQCKTSQSSSSNPNGNTNTSGEVSSATTTSIAQNIQSASQQYASSSDCTDGSTTDSSSSICSVASSIASAPTSQVADSIVGADSTDVSTIASSVSTGTGTNTNTSTRNIGIALIAGGAIVFIAGAVGAYKKYGIKDLATDIEAQQMAELADFNASLKSSNLSPQEQAKMKLNFTKAQKEEYVELEELYAEGELSDDEFDAEFTTFDEKLPSDTKEIFRSAFTPPRTFLTHKASKNNAQSSTPNTKNAKAKFVKKYGASISAMVFGALFAGVGTYMTAKSGQQKSLGLAGGTQSSDALNTYIEQMGQAGCRAGFCNP